MKKLCEEGYTVICAEADADVLKAQTAMKVSTPTGVIGEDTDLLILLIYHIKLYTTIKRGGHVSTKLRDIGLETIHFSWEH